MKKTLNKATFNLYYKQIVGNKINNKSQRIDKVKNADLAPMGRVLDKMEPLIEGEDFSYKLTESYDVERV